jgi:hypothetical protein
MPTHSPKRQAPKPTSSVIQWLLDSDPSIRWRCHSRWWIIQAASANPLLAGFSSVGQSQQAISPWNEAPAEEAGWHFHRLPRDT